MFPYYSWHFRKCPLFFGILSPFSRCSSKQMQSASVAPLLSPLLLHLWAPLLNAHLSLLLLLWSVYCSTFWAFSFCYTFGFSLLLLLWSVYCYSFEVFTATPLKCLLLHLWAFSSATPLGFLFCYSFGISLLLNLPVSNENWRKMKHVILLQFH